MVIEWLLLPPLPAWLPLLVLPTGAAECLQLAALLLLFVLVLQRLLLLAGAAANVRCSRCYSCCCCWALLLYCKKVLAFLQQGLLPAAEGSARQCTSTRRGVLLLP